MKGEKKNKTQATFSIKNYIWRSVEKLHAQSILDDEKKSKSLIIEEILTEGFKAKGIDPEEYGSTS